MVLTLKDICLNYIANNFAQIDNFNQSLLSVIHKEAIIERLTYHNGLSLLGLSTNPSPAELRLNFNYQKKLILNFFNGHLNELKFVVSDQVDDAFFKLVTTFVDSDCLVLKSVSINRCLKLTGYIQNYFF